VTVDKLQNLAVRTELFLKMIAPVPEEWKAKRVKQAGEAPELEKIPCDNYEDLVTAWKSAMKWTDGLDCALSVMLASIASVPSVGDQLWVKIVGPASCGKSTLCEAVSINEEYVLAKSTIRGFHSGFGDGTEDNSLIAKLGGKTLVTKDGDTLLQSPNLGQILSEARDVYDGSSRTHYRNKTSRDYTGIRMTWIICGTASMRTLDSSELGQRFLDCVIMDGIDDDLEDEILWKVAQRTDKNMIVEAVGDEAQQHDPAMATAIAMTGGYIDWLRHNAIDEMNRITGTESSLRKCTRLGKFVAFLRARPSTQQDETAEREFAARLVSQHVRLAKCLAFVLNRKSLDQEVMRRCTKVALDTARGQTMDIIDYLYECGEDGCQAKALSTRLAKDSAKLHVLLRFLRQIHVVELFHPSKIPGIQARPHWRLVSKMVTLYENIMELAE